LAFASVTVPPAVVAVVQPVVVQVDKAQVDDPKPSNAQAATAWRVRFKEVLFIFFFLFN
jgi:hypothetical protein